MENITHVGPSKLDLVLAEAANLSDENKTKVIIITDLNRIMVLLGGKPMGPKTFDQAYDSPIEYLEKVQHDFQVELNTKLYKDRVFRGL